MSFNTADLEKRLQLLEKLGDPLPRLQRHVDWEAFRPLFNRMYKKKCMSNAGRQPYDVVLMFKVLVLQHLYNLSEEQIDYQIRDRYSFCHYLNLSPEQPVPDARTVWRNSLISLRHILLPQSFGTGQ